MRNKILLFLIILTIFITGCQLANNPNSKVEELLGKYQKVDNDINISYIALSEDENISNEQKDKYKALIEDQYEDMSYEIQEEKIDGDVAVITVQVKVKNYKDAIEKYSKNNYEVAEYHNLVIAALEDVTEKVTYTIDFNLNKVNDEWIIEELTTEQQKKLLGIY